MPLGPPSRRSRVYVHQRWVICVHCEFSRPCAQPHASRYQTGSPAGTRLPHSFALYPWCILCKLLLSQQLRRTLPSTVSFSQRNPQHDETYLPQDQETKSVQQRHRFCFEPAHTPCRALPYHAAPYGRRTRTAPAPRCPPSWAGRGPRGLLATRCCGTALRRVSCRWGQRHTNALVSTRADGWCMHEG